MQIKTRLTLQFIIVVILIIILSFGVIYYSSALYRKKDFYQRLENKAKTSAEMFFTVKSIDTSMIRVFNQIQKDRFPHENISIYDEKEKEIYTNNDTLTFETTKGLFGQIRKEGRKEFVQGTFEVLGINYTNGPRNFVIFAGAYDQHGFSKLHNLRNTLIVLFLIIISIVAAAGWLYARRALKPLTNVVNEVQSISVDHLEKRLVRGNSKDEIGKLIDTFNHLLGRVESAFKLQKLFVNGVSHELKNPLTTITSQLQVVLLKERSASEYMEIISSVLDDIRNLNKTTVDLIEYARLTSETNIHLSPVRIDDLLWFAKDYFSRINKQYKVQLDLENLPDDERLLQINGNTALLKVAFINLIDNACKFSQDHTCRVVLSINSRQISIRFIDMGIGISEEDLTMIFEPFFRSNKTAEVKGHGIGLALTKKIVEMHNADIKVSSEKNKGTCFVVVFNIYSAANNKLLNEEVK